MAGHFASLGFPVSTVDEVEALAERVRPDCGETAVATGSYLRWEGGDGAELWLQLDRRGRLIGLNPHFSGRSQLQVRLVESVQTAHDSALDGAFSAWTLDPEGDEEEWSQLIFDAPDAACHSGLALPAVGEVQIAAFAHSLDVHGSAEAFAAAQAGEELAFASQSFIALGLWAEELGTEGSPADASFSGHVVESATKENPLTRQPYTWIAVETLGGVFDVVAAPDLAPEPPPARSVVFGTFWLSGRLLGEPRSEPAAAETPRQERRGLLRRLFG
ncbi:MAG TPA: hypothetical protein VE757_06680 [Gaiellaceae bacterium]|nr:hypothetical protein [Gaiellaceae bacterium]